MLNFSVLLRVSTYGPNVISHQAKSKSVWNIILKKNNFVVNIFYFIYCHVNYYFDLKRSVSVGNSLCVDGYILILIGNSGFVVVRMSRTNSFAC